MRSTIPTPERELYEEIVRRVLLVTEPEKVVIFGSRARGDHRRDSDIDVLIIGESSQPRHVRSRPLYRAMASLPVEVDIMMYTPREAEEWSGVRQALVTRAAREGLLVYEKAA